MAYIKAPKDSQQRMYDYLEDLRQSGQANMFGAGQYLEVAFGLERKEARTILSDWMGAHGTSRELPESLTGQKCGRIVQVYEEAE